jgi:hypothetical protein
VHIVAIDGRCKTLASDPKFGVRYQARGWGHIETRQLSVRTASKISSVTLFTMSTFIHASVGLAPQTLQAQVPRKSCEKKHSVSACTYNHATLLRILLKIGSTAIRYHHVELFVCNIPLLLGRVFTVSCRWNSSHAELRSRCISIYST